MALPRPLIKLGQVALVAAILLPPGALWLSGRFARDADRQLPPPAPAPLATLPRSEAPAVAVSRPPASPDLPATAPPPVTVGPGLVPVLPPAPGAAPVPEPRAGHVVGEPQGLPDPNKSEAMPR